MNDLSRVEPIEIATTSSLVADRIRQGILDGTFSPGSRIGEAQLSERLSVSRGPVREAMQRLIQEGLLRAERNRGVFVVDLGPEDIEDIYTARGAIEHRAVLILLAGDRIDAETDGLEAIVGRMDAAAASGGWQAIIDLDLEFHEALVATSRSRRMIRMYATLVAETRLCLTRLATGYADPGELVDEHREIIAALRARDAARALAVVATHFTYAIEVLEAARAGRA